MKLKREDIERREKLAFDYFTKNPQATGESFLTKLADGTLTGQKEPKMNIGSVYQIRKQAIATINGQVGPEPTMHRVVAPVQVQNPVVQAPTNFAVPATAALPPEIVSALQQVIHALRSNPSLTAISDIRVDRNGISVGRTTRTEDRLTID